MTAEFTGERVIPGQVDVDLWNEHIARYAFAAQFAAGRRVLDAGCGSGYGTAELARRAAFATGIDIAPEAVSSAASAFSLPNVAWTCASCTDVPLPDGSSDLVVAFEVIEHLTDWPRLIEEARRLLTPAGLFLVSTPNKSFYAETRRESGPNPFHHHEFEFAEFRCALKAAFPHVSMFLQDHVEAVAFRPVSGSPTAGARIEDAAEAPENSSFFIALCSIAGHDYASSFVYVPRAANAVREKLVHIQRLEGEVAMKDSWLAEQQQTHKQLVDDHRAQKADLEKSNRWAEELDRKLKASGQRIVDLQEELAAEQKAGREVAGAYEQQLQELRTWATETERRLTSELEARTADLQHQVSELGRCVELLHQTEATLEERTRWALQLDEDRNRLTAELTAVRASRWFRLGRMAGLGPELREG